jgi:hypothetical protein
MNKIFIILCLQIAKIPLLFLTACFESLSIPITKNGIAAIDAREGINDVIQVSLHCRL